ncbi:DUF2730 family protein [Sagittula salina]|uniref:DUF2730 family protein n=1 Tax=Sagittula salina TaxID=2820268 RepID=A0A940MQF7_9RHOB|nr:DUF2730 family protein [Sagittula salina]MBP0483958.1 DUF2730 family protein [Sagittula salina]
MLDLATLKDIAAVAAFLLSLATGIYAFFATRSKDVDGRIDAVDDRCSRHERRIDRLETTVDNLPAKKDLHEIQLGVASLRGDLERIDATLIANRDGVQRLMTVTERLETYLLNRS